jgi:hypothetical protein
MSGSVVGSTTCHDAPASHVRTRTATALSCPLALVVGPRSLTFAVAMQVVGRFVADARPPQMNIGEALRAA